jgi:hypothetical protein
MTINTISREVLTGTAAEGAATGYAPKPRYTPAYQARIDEAATLFGAACNGSKRAMLTLTEALTTSDLPSLLGGVFDRELLSTYEQLPQIWSQFASRTTVNDFRPKTYIDLLGGRARLDAVAERGEYPARAPSEALYSLKVGKFGGVIPLSWEMLINDDLGALQDLPDRLAQGSRDTEDYLATGALLGAAGPLTSFFKAGNGNAPVTGAGTALSTQSLSDALTAVSTRKDTEGRPIVVSTYVLMVPPQLEVAANNIVNALEIRDIVGTRTTITANWLNGKVKVVANPWIPIIDTSGTVATTWYLLPAPNTARPAVQVGFLRGHEVPELRVSSNTGNSLGGGSLSPEDGSFENDTIAWRLRHILGTTVLDPIATYVSKGA